MQLMVRSLSIQREHVHPAGPLRPLHRLRVGHDEETGDVPSGGSQLDFRWDEVCAQDDCAGDPAAMVLHHGDGGAVGHRHRGVVGVEHAHVHLLHWHCVDRRLHLLHNNACIDCPAIIYLYCNDMDRVYYMFV